MSEVSTFRLYLMRAMYVFMAVSLAIFELPALLHPENLSRLDSVVLSVLGAFALGKSIEQPIRRGPARHTGLRQTDLAGTHEGNGEGSDD